MEVTYEDMCAVSEAAHKRSRELLSECEQAVYVKGRPVSEAGEEGRAFIRWLFAWAHAWCEIGDACIRATLPAPELLPEETAYLAESGRCSNPDCDHLLALHNEHCCPSCMVTGCRCSWWDQELGQIGDS